MRSSTEVGYAATETLAGSRLNTALKDVATQVTVMTPEFLQDLAIRNVDEAMSYSLNGENGGDNLAVNLAAGIEATVRPFGGSSRLRGLSPPNRAVDFFDTFIPIDSYNIERITFASGPNSILFGNSNPSGVIDSTVKRAQLGRPKYAVTYQVDERGSHRAAIDLNQPIVKNRLALRLDGLNDRQHDWRAPAFANQDRFFGSLVFRPFQKLTVRAYHETVSVFTNPVRNTLVQDHVTPWVLAGQPAFNNGGGLTAAFPATPTTSPFARTDVSRPFYVLGPDGVMGPVGQQGNTVIMRGFDSMIGAAGVPLDNFEHSIIDQGLYPFNRSFSGNANQAKLNAWRRGVVAEANPLENLFLEVGFNQERFSQKAFDTFNIFAGELHVDTNRFLNDRVTPNPNFGRYFFDETANPSLPSAKNYGWKEQKRLSLSYELDFEHRPGWMKWLGRHRFAGLLDRLETYTVGAGSTPTIIGDYSFTTANPASRIPAMRHYIDPLHPTIHLPFDPLVDGIIALPGAFDANGKQVNIASWDPSVPASAVTLNNVTRNLVDSRALSLQSFLLQNRVVVSYGQRWDEVDVQQAPGLAPNLGSPTSAVGADFFGTARGDIPWETVKTDAPRTHLKSIVVHPFKWLSASYAESTSQRVEASPRRNLEGALINTGAGAGKEYGL
ncbi:MAG: hypothetical protein ACREF9_18065, partial [Opitutaceae bacterium]